MRPQNSTVPGLAPEKGPGIPSPEPRPWLSNNTDPNPPPENPEPTRPPEPEGLPSNRRAAPRASAAKAIEAQLVNGSPGSVRAAFSRILFHLTDSEVNALAQQAADMLKTST